ncbi:MAG: 50S ribosomal protein L29 [Magnetococcus sp. DMHC-1]|nr:50S ribosomal protein L29 [Magnetococcales bacterium]
MTATTAADLRGLSDAALEEKLRTLSQESFNLRFQKATMRLEKTSRIGQVRKEIARIKTVLGARVRKEQES